MDVDVQTVVLARLTGVELGAAFVLDLTLVVDGEAGSGLSTLVTLELGRRGYSISLYSYI